MGALIIAMDAQVRRLVSFQMQRLAIFLLLCAALSPATATAQRSRIVRQSFEASRILWLGAHPDDESLIAPLLGRFCVEGASRCRMIVLTRGENGVCAAGAHCGPDLGRTRTEEMAAASALLHAELELWQLPDVIEGVQAAWDHSAGGHAELVEALRQAIVSFGPSAVVTFDPEHGSTCHAAHRFAGTLAMEASGRLPVYFVETRALAIGGKYELAPAIDTATGLVTFDLGPSWHFLIDDLRVHRSQFDEETIASLETAEERTLALLPAGLRTSVVYRDSCP